jgi:DNA-binding transcriptional LysR family regulator
MIMANFVQHKSARCNERCSSTTSTLPLNLARIDLCSMQLVVQCAHSGTLTAGARKCHMSVSGASHRLKSLEASLGTQLFRRHRRGLQATLAGEAVAAAGEAIFTTLHGMARQLKKTGQATQACCMSIRPSVS